MLYLDTMDGHAETHQALSAVAPTESRKVLLKSHNVIRSEEKRRQFCERIKETMNYEAAEMLWSRFSYPMPEPPDTEVPSVSNRSWERAAWLYRRDLQHRRRILYNILRLQLN